MLQNHQILCTPSSLQAWNLSMCMAAQSHAWCLFELWLGASRLTGRQTNLFCPNVIRVKEGSILRQMACYTLFALSTNICTMHIYQYFSLLDIILFNPLRFQIWNSIYQYAYFMRMLIGDKCLQIYPLVSQSLVLTQSFHHGFIYPYYYLPV